MRIPDHAGLLGRRAVHGVEGIWNGLAAVAGGGVLELRESVGGARRYRTRLAASEVVDLCVRTLRGVVDADLALVSGCIEGSERALRLIGDLSRGARTGGPVG